MSFMATHMSFRPMPGVAKASLKTAIQRSPDTPLDAHALGAHAQPSSSSENFYIDPMTDDIVFKRVGLPEDPVEDMLAIWNNVWCVGVQDGSSMHARFANAGTSSSLGLPWQVKSRGIRNVRWSSPPKHMAASHWPLSGRP